MTSGYSRREDREMFDFDICVVGGCGRVGLPLAIAFASKDLKVIIYDLDKDKIDRVKSGIMPFNEAGCQEKLRGMINRNLVAADSPDSISRCRFVIITVGTPVDEHLNPLYADMLNFFRSVLPHLVDGQYIILRSTLYPGTSQRIDKFLRESRANVHLAFCPERVAEGKVLAELESLPQIVSAFDEQCLQAVSDLFKRLTKDIVVLDPMEAELAKVFSNVWRYIQFSIANQFFMLACERGLDFYKIHQAMTYKYPRTQGLPRPGFAAGPCLFKDTMQLAAFSNNSFFLGHAAMLVNEGLPNYVVQKLKGRTNLMENTVGILGMAFKADSDDERDSLSFKLKRILEIEAKKVYCSDPYVKRDDFISAEALIDICDIVILATPHEQYRKLHIMEDKLLVDIWNFYGKGVAL
jgi:UDP-N-acetyl-D-mannosaminuronic acid dehydrogenase